MQLSFNIFRLPSTRDRIKTNYKILDCLSIDILNFNFAEKDLGLVTPPHFGYNFSRKMSFMFYSIN